MARPLCLLLFKGLKNLEATNASSWPGCAAMDGPTGALAKKNTTMTSREKTVNWTFEQSQKHILNFVEEQTIHVCCQGTVHVMF